MLGRTSTDSHCVDLRAPSGPPPSPLALPPCTSPRKTFLLKILIDPASRAPAGAACKMPYPVPNRIFGHCLEGFKKARSLRRPEDPASGASPASKMRYPVLVGHCLPKPPRPSIMSVSQSCLQNAPPHPGTHFAHCLRPQDPAS